MSFDCRGTCLLDPSVMQVDHNSARADHGMQPTAPRAAVDAEAVSCTERTRRERDNGSSQAPPTEESSRRQLGAAIVITALLQCSCTSAIDTRETPPESAENAKGYGTVIGSILLSATAGVSGIDERSSIALKAKKYEAKIRRREVYEYGFASRTKYLGETYRVVFDVDVEKRFIIHAPVGTYEVLNISQTITGIFGERNTACVMEGPAAFDVRERKTTYVGRLTIAAGLMSDREVRMHQALQNARGVFVIGRPEALLTMKGSVTDMKEETLRELGMDQGAAARSLDTHLMRASERVTWTCEGIADDGRIHR